MAILARSSDFCGFYGASSEGGQKYSLGKSPAFPSFGKERRVMTVSGTRRSIVVTRPGKIQTPTNIKQKQDNPVKFHFSTTLSTMNPTTPSSLQAFSANVVKAGLHKLIEKMKDSDSAVQILQKQLLSLCLQDQADNYQDQYPRERRLDDDEQDLPKTGDHKYSTVIKALDYMSEEQYQSLEIFHKHLIANYFSTVKLSKIKGSKWTSLVTHPAPAIIHFYYNVSPAYIIVQDLTQCGESKAMMIMNTLEDIMSKFDLGLKIVNRRSISKKKKKSKRAVEKSQKSNKSVLWETKTHLMLPDNEAASTMRKVEDCKLYRTLVAYFKPSEQGTSSSEEHRARRLDGTSSRDNNIPSLDQIHEITSDQGSSSSAEHDIQSLDQIHEVTSYQGTSSSAEQDIQSLDQIHEVKSDQRTSSSAEHDIPPLDTIHEITSDQGTLSSAEQDIESSDTIHEITSDQGTLSSAEQDIQSLDQTHEVKSDQSISSSGGHSARLLDGTSSREHDIPSLDRGKHETKLPLTAKKTKEVEEMECEIMQLKETVRSLEDKFDESKRKLRAKEVIGVKSTETQTSKEQEEKFQLKMNDLELTVSRLEEELRRSKEKNVEAEKSFKSMEIYYKQQLRNLRKENEALKDKTSALERKLQNKEEDIHVTLADLGRALVERDTLVKEMKARGTAHSSPVEVTSSSSQTSEMPPSPEAPTRIRGAEAVTERDEHLTANNEATEENSGSNGAAVAVQESQAEANRRDTISLANIPTTTVERGLYFNYKLLLLRITRMLLSADVIKLKEWATSILSVNVTASVDDVFVELDRRGVISAVNLEKLREFFEKILRFDLVHMIDCFIIGDYSYLRNTSEGNPRRNNQGSTPGVTAASQRATASSRTSLQSSVLTSGKHSLHSQARTSEVEESYVPPQSRRPDTSAVVTPSNRRTEVSGGTTHQPVRGQLVTNAPGSKNATSNGSTTNRARSQVDMGSNGRKLSKFQRADSAKNNNSKTQAPNDDSDSDDDDDDSEWLCSHYKRRCLVKFDCCDKYWPCHRCHNNESKCGQKKLKSRDTKFLKCVSCGREQQFSSQSQFCNNCHKRFARYFCAICKHLTGTDDNPYHCEKCGICRIHSDRSFHCDVCGVCLDVQLRGNHKCRAGSAHDECCICLEDAFTGCQILPCSHKVHKECATQMIRSGITRCPICRESFAHKLERRNLPPSKKPPGK